MISTLKLAEDNSRTTNANTAIGMGKLWTGGEHRRFYVNEALLDFANQELDFSYEFAMSGLYIDLVSKEYCTDRPVEDAELVRFEVLYRALGKLINENLNKEVRSTWTGNVRKCTNILHFIGQSDNTYLVTLSGE